MWTATVPIIHQCLSKQVLPDRLNDQLVGHGLTWKITDRGSAGVQRCIRKAHTKPVDVVKRVVKRSKIVEGKSRDAGLRRC
jgi:hypothetical protein